MPKSTMAVKAARKAPAKKSLAKGGFKLGRRKVERTPAGTAVLYGQALVGNADAREELRDAITSARTAYRRSSGRSGRPNLVVLLQDRKASREAGNAITSARAALSTAGRKRKKPRSAKGPVIAVVALAGAGGAAVLARRNGEDTEAPNSASPNAPAPAAQTGPANGSS